MAKQLLTERFAFSGGKVDRSNPARPVIREALLCGPVSRNKRRYLKEAFAGDRVTRYNGVPVRVAAVHEKPGAAYHEQIGVVEGARHRADGMPLGDIPVNPEKELGRAFLWDAENQPAACSMSHVANCETRPGAGGWQDVIELVEAYSVDVIGAKGAGTTKSVFERFVMPTTLRAVLESYRQALPAERQPAVRRLLLLSEEDSGAGAVLATEIEEPAAEHAEEAVALAFRSAATVLLEGVFAEGAPADALDRVTRAVAEWRQLTGKTAPAANPPGARTETTAFAEALALLDPALARDVVILANTPADQRAAVAQRLKEMSAPAAEAPRTAGRDRIPVPQKPVKRVTWD